MTYIKLKEFKELEKGKVVNYPIIAISGSSGSGKGTHSKLLQKKLKEDFGLELPVYEVGEFFREEAKKRGMTIAEFDEKLTKDEKLSDLVDKEIDKKTLKTALERCGIFVGRLATHIIGEHGFKIFIIADPDIIAERISKDPSREEYKRGMSKEEIKEEIIRRDRNNKERYKRLYGIDYEKDLPAKADIVVKNDREPEIVLKEYYDPLVSWLKEKGFVK